MQTLSLDDNVYVLLLLGMVAVGAHAYSLYGQPIEKPNGATRWRFLSSIPIELATTPSRYRLGLFFYIVVFELIYLVLASSSSLVVVTYQVSGRQDLTGALSDSVSPNGTVPILASTALILLTQIRPVSQAERFLRRAAHRLAFIPDGLKQVRERISSYLVNAELPEPAFAVDVIESVQRHADTRTAVELQRSQRIILWLYESTLGTQGNHLWDDEGAEELLRLFEPTRFEVAQLRQEVIDAARFAKLPEPVDDDGVQSAESSPGPWHALLSRSLQLQERLTLLLCLLVINQPDVDTREQPLLVDVIEHSRRQRQSEVSDIVIKSCVFGALACVLLLFAFERAETRLRAELAQSPYVAKAPYGAWLERRIEVNAGAAPLFPRAGLTADERRGLTFDSTQRGDLLDALEEALLIGVTFLCAVYVALALNRPHVRAPTTPGDLQLPMPAPAAAHHLFTAVLAALVTVLTLFLYFFVTEALLPALRDNVDVLSLDIINPFTSLLWTLPRFAIAAAVIASFVVWADVYLARRATAAVSHVRWRPSFALTSAGLLAALVAALALLASSVVTEPVTTLLDASARTGIAFIGFACFLTALATVLPRHPERYTSGLIPAAAQTSTTLAGDRMRVDEQTRALGSASLLGRARAVAGRLFDHTEVRPTGSRTATDPKRRPERRTG